MQSMARQKSAATVDTPAARGDALTVHMHTFIDGWVLVHEDEIRVGRLTWTLIQ